MRVLFQGSRNGFEETDGQTSPTCTVVYVRTRASVQCMHVDRPPTHINVGSSSSLALLLAS